MRWRKVNKSFVSELDDFLEELRQQFPESKSQRQERSKHQKIAHKRDIVEVNEEKQEIWAEF